MCNDGGVSLLGFVLEVLGFLLLLLVLLDLRVDSAPAVALESVVLLRLFLLGLQPLILSLVISTARDLIDQAGKVLGGQRRNRFNIALEYKEVACFDENVLGFERIVVLLSSHHLVVDAVLARALARYRSLPLLFLAGIVLVDGHHPSRLRVIARRPVRFVVVAILVSIRVAVRLGLCCRAVLVNDRRLHLAAAVH